MPEMSGLWTAGVTGQLHAKVLLARLNLNLECFVFFFKKFFRKFDLRCSLQMQNYTL